MRTAYRGSSPCSFIVFGMNPQMQHAVFNPAHSVLLNQLGLTSILRLWSLNDFLSLTSSLVLFILSNHSVLLYLHYLLLPNTKKRGETPS